MTDELMWRVSDDSSGLREPRVFIRAFLEPGTLERAVACYERAQGVTADGRFAFKTLRLAMVGAFLLIEGTADDLRPYRSTTGTLLVNEIAPYHERLVAEGAEITVAPARVPTGAGFTARHPDGTTVEYVEHRPTAEGF
ncbi:VOC family protein [Streptomyces sp. NPDC050560]|uniref:VOC family protein n=1 Tax=Streptomyces sp. NPDC050560 TaxID=3365630 RepID=UPI0037951981